MEFFKQLFELPDDLDVSIRIKRKNDRLTINVLPYPGTAGIASINITGTPDELDSGFFDVIKGPVTEAGLQVQVIESTKNTSAEKPAKKAEKKDGKKADKQDDGGTDEQEEEVKEPTLFD